MYTVWPEIPTGYDRVRAHTASLINERIDRLTLGNIERYREASQDAIVARLTELDREWDIDRAVMANFAIVGGLTLTLGLKKSPGWMYLFGAQMGFLLLHSVVGWCPPVVVFRRLGYRTKDEIEVERRALIELLARAPVHEVSETSMSAADRAAG